MLNSIKAWDSHLLTQIAPFFASKVHVLAGCSGVPLWSMHAVETEGENRKTKQKKTREKQLELASRYEKEFIISYNPFDK